MSSLIPRCMVTEPIKFKSGFGMHLIPERITVLLGGNQADLN